jgi:hypothetical protein
MVFKMFKKIGLSLVLAAGEKTSFRYHPRPKCSVVSLDRQASCWYVGITFAKAKLDQLAGTGWNSGSFPHALVDFLGRPDNVCHKEEHLEC